MTTCEIVYFKTERGDEPAKVFVDGLDTSSKRKFWRKIDYLKQFGRSLPEPHAKNLGNGIHELRFRGRDGHIRILYFFFKDNVAVMTNGFKKKTNDTPTNELGIALQRMRIFLANPGKYNL